VRLSKGLEFLIDMQKIREEKIDSLSNLTPASDESFPLDGDAKGVSLPTAGRHERTLIHEGVRVKISKLRTRINRERGQYVFESRSDCR